MSLAPLRKKLARRKWLLALAGAGCLLALGAGPAVAALADQGQGIPFGQSMTGEMTYYNNIGTDASGGQIDPVTQDLAAVSHVWWTTADPNDDPLCDGVSIQLIYDGQTLTLPVMDKCTACDATHIDVSQAVFQQLAPLGVGVLSPVTWQFVSSSGQPGPNPSPSGSPSSAPSPGNFAVQPSPSPSPSAATAGGCAAAWSAGGSYSPGNVVSDNGDNWTSTWWSTGAEPGAPISWNVWTDDGSC